MPRVRGIGVAKSLAFFFFDHMLIKFFGYKCPLCLHPALKYLPLPSKYINDYKKSGGKLDPKEAETLNIKNYQCPTCLGSDRDRLIYLYLQKLFKSYDNSKRLNILDFAPCPPLTKRIKTNLDSFNKTYNYRTADLYEPNVDDKVDIMDMSIYKEDSFDIIICSHVLEHVRDDTKGMHEIKRILNSYGKAILLVPINLNQENTDEDPNLSDDQEKIRRFGQANHVRQYSKSGFVARLNKVGFSVQEVGIKQLGKQNLKKNALTKSSCLYVCSKI
jgi:SAM-dependent methyltransferase